MVAVREVAVLSVEAAASLPVLADDGSIVRQVDIRVAGTHGAGARRRKVPTGHAMLLVIDVEAWNEAS